ncbi:MAG: APC family permease, partial [Planctomycetales bacterium]
TMFALVMITTGIITSIHGAPSMAEYGLSLVVIYLIVAVVFLIPSSLISAELATGWPEDGGVYVWVKEAFGERLGFVAIWQQWMETVIWFPSIMTMTVALGFYAFNPALGDNSWFVFVSVNVLFWSLTGINLLGMQASGVIATIGTLLGRIFPILFMTVLAIIYLAKGNPSETRLSLDNLLPDFSDIGLLSFAVGAFFTFAGIEVSACNAASAKNPRRNYPIAIIISASIALVLSTLIALSIAIVVPQDQISVDEGVMQAIERILNVAGIGWMLPYAGLLIVVGILGEVNNWIPAPTRGLLVAGRDGAVSPYWQHVNRHASHSRILIFQAIIVSAISTILLFFEVEIAFWVMNIVPTMLYLIMYFLMFAAGVRLRYTHPHIPRRYKVPFGNAGIWTLAVVGTVAGVAGICFSFIPPKITQADDHVAYIIAVASGFIVFGILPFIVFGCRRPGWKTAFPENEDNQPG